MVIKMLTLNRTIRDNLFEFMDNGALFNYIDDVDTSLKNHKEKVWIRNTVAVMKFM